MAGKHKPPKYERPRKRIKQKQTDRKKEKNEVKIVQYFSKGNLKKMKKKYSLIDTFTLEDSKRTESNIELFLIFDGS